MKIQFSGLETPILVDSSAVTVLEIENRQLFTKVCQSLAFEQGTDGGEPYTLWDAEGKEIRVREVFLAVPNPLYLPWDARAVTSKLFDIVSNSILNNDTARNTFDNLGAQIHSFANAAELQMNANYSFTVDWSLPRLLRSFGFSADIESCETLLDQLILFMDFVTDMALKRSLLFMNLKLFLSDDEVNQLFEHIFFQQIPVLDIENIHIEQKFKHERKIWVDQDFIES